MAAKDPAGWYYVGNAELRYMDTDGWTDQYKPIEDRLAVAPPVNNESATQSGSCQRRPGSIRHGGLRAAQPCRSPANRPLTSGQRETRARPWVASRSSSRTATL